MTTDASTPPTNRYDAADWLIGRHPWARQLVERITGPLDASADWLDTLAQAVVDSQTWSDAWASYERKHPAPRDDADFYQWQAAGPEATPTAQAFGVMSGGEKRLVRLISTLSDTPTPWSVAEVSFDPRGAAVLADWLAIVRAQLPESMYSEGAR